MRASDESLADILTHSARHFGQKAAVSSNGISISYSDLNKIANQTAQALIKGGVQPGSRIGIYLDKSIHAVAAIFGILKAGCAYVPLDPHSPMARTSAIILDSELAGLIIGASQLGPLSSLPLKALNLNFILNMDATERSEQATTELDTKVEKRDLAYLLYTSGSTGRPKGVMVTHANALAFINWSQTYFRITDADILSSHAPFHFDLSIFDIFVSLRAGAQLCLVPSGISYFPTSLIDFIRTHKITVWYAVPSILIQVTLSGLLSAERLSFLRALIFAGEVFPHMYLNRLRKALPHTEFINLYGPTETNVITYFNLEDSPQNLTENVPIGAACPYCEIWVVDSALKPVKPGCDGELIVSSETLMSGYWRDPEKTESVFKTLNLDGKDRLYYLTGDIVNEPEKGVFVFRFRKDHMIKIRGFRVELGEIEAALYKNEHILEAVAIALPDLEVGNKIKAVIVLKSGATLELEDLSRFCAKLLPSYMIPEIVEFRESLPRTATGKVDRYAL